MMGSSHLIQRSPYTVAGRWDGLFFMVLLPVIVGWLFVLNGWLG